MLDAYPNLHKMYDENDGNTQMLFLKNATATFSSFTAAPEVIRFYACGGVEQTFLPENARSCQKT